MELLRILGAGLLALVLLAGFFLYVRADAERRAFDAAARSATWVVQLRAREYEKFVDSARERLLDLGQRSEVRALEPDVCQATLVPQLSALPGYLDAGAARPTGELVCTARRARRDDGLMSSADFARSAKRREAMFGRYAIDPITRHGTVTLVAPAIDGAGEVRAVIGVTLDLATLTRGAGEMTLLEGASVMVVDGAGVVLEYSPDRTRWVGEFLTGPVREQLAGHGHGTMRAADLSGAPARLVFGPLARDVARLGDASVVVVLPDAIVSREVSWSVARHAAGIGLVIALLLLIAWTLLAAFVTRPAAMLAHAMRRLRDRGTGDHLPPRLKVDGIRGPLRGALTAFDAVAGRLVQQDEDLRLLQEQRRDREIRIAQPSGEPSAPEPRAPMKPKPAANSRPQPAPPPPRQNTAEAHWGLAEPAFENAPNPKFLYPSPGHEAVLRGLTYAVRQRRGCGVLTGKAGCGKTTLVRSLIRRLDAARYDVAFLLSPLRDPLDLLREVLYELGVETDESRRPQLLHLLGARFLHNLGRGQETVIIIDEAQLARARTLKELGLLLNYQTNERSLVTLLLIGSPEFDERLTASRHLDGRLGVRCRITPLDAEHTGKYVTHRLTVAGGAATIFTPDAHRLIHEMTDGIPRAINDLCDNALLLGSQSAVSQIDADTLRAMISPSLPSSARPLAFDLPATQPSERRPSAESR